MNAAMRTVPTREANARVSTQSRPKDRLNGGCLLEGRGLLRVSIHSKPGYAQMSPDLFIRQLA
jgi:hypothetical protein